VGASIRLLAVGLVLFALAAAVGVDARASQLVDRNVSAVRLTIRGDGVALLSYRKNGRARHVFAWGALNAREPNPVIPQVRFRLDYTGGWARTGRQLWRSFRGVCLPYDGPALSWLVTACKAPDGSYWAVQSWQRIQPMRGLPAFRPDQMKWELHLSHWTGPLAELQISPNWTYGGEWQGLFGRLLYRGQPVHGFRRSAGGAGSTYTRYFYIDTFDSAWGQGWKRAAGKSTHNPNGGFCFSFVPDRPYANLPKRPPGNGKRHRVTVMGPGVTPDVEWEGAGLGRYSPARDASFNARFDQILSGDRICAPER
jgi:hypothetical protein